MIIGVDPGFTGAIVGLIHLNTLHIKDLPIRMIGTKKQIDEKAFANIVSDLNHRFTIDYIVIEEIGAMPGQGIASTARFTYNAGILLGVFAGLGLSDKVIKVRPGVWKPALNLSSDKKKSLKLAIKLFPKYKDSFRLMKHDGRAEAALIAYYARKSL